MSRRSRSTSSNKSNIAVYIIIAVAVIVALVAGKFILDKRAQHFAGLGELSILDMQDGATSLSGSEYRVTGKIVDKIKWTADRGQVIGISVDQGENGKGNMPIFVPAGVDKINLERGHSYTFKVEINREGFPVALDVKAQ